MRVLHANPARLDPPDTPRRGAEQKYVAGQALDREIFIQRAHHRAFGFGDHQIIGGIRNGPSGSDCRETRATTPANTAIYALAMHVGAAAPASACDSITQHLHLVVNIAAI